MKAFKNISLAFSESWLGLGLLVGFFLALVIFFSVSSQFAVHIPHVFSPALPENEATSPPAQEKSDFAPLGGEAKQSPVVREEVKKKEPTNYPTDFNSGEEGENAGPPPPLKPICDLSDWRYDGCEMWGDARTVSGVNKSSVYFIPPPSQLATAEARNWSIRSQSRKIVGVREVIVKSLNLSNLHEAPNCTVRHSVPAVVFAVGGLTFNFWHAFSDVLVPLFTTSRAFNGEVQLVITDNRHWLPKKYERIFKALSRFELVDLDADPEVRCYPHLIVGLRGHRDFDIDPERAPNHYDMFSFRMFIREAYSLPLYVDLPYKASEKPNKKPRLMIILRGSTRRFVNAEEVVAAIELFGFEVVKVEPGFVVDLDEFSRMVDSCDVLMGAHGAGLTNMVFLRTNAVVLQVIPWGHMEWAGDLFFGGPAHNMRIRHITHNITAEESTLYDKYGKDHPVITDPDAVYKNGTNGLIYWGQQDIRLNVTRFHPTLEKVMQLIKE